MKYVINLNLVPHFIDLLLEKLQNSEFLLISFDESFNKLTQNHQMDTGVLLLSKEVTGCVSLGWSQCKLMFLCEVVKNREEMELHQLINIGRYGLHTIHSSLKTGI